MPCFLFTSAGTAEEKVVTVTLQTPYCLHILIQEVRKSDNMNTASSTKCTNNLFSVYNYSVKVYM
jgi:hypothetical protein